MFTPNFVIVSLFIILKPKSLTCDCEWCLKAVMQMPVETQSELCRQNVVPSFPQSRRSIVAEHPLVLLEQLLMNEKVCIAFIETAKKHLVVSFCGFVVRTTGMLA